MRALNRGSPGMGTYLQPLASDYPLVENDTGADFWQAASVQADQAEELQMKIEVIGTLML